MSDHNQEIIHIFKAEGPDAEKKMEQLIDFARELGGYCIRAN